MKKTNPSLDLLLTSRTFVQNPYPVYETLRTTSPVYWCEPWGAWVISEYDNIVNISRAPDKFANYGRMSALLRHMPNDIWKSLAPLRQHFASGIMHTDPPDHTRLRNLVTRAFTPRVIEMMRTHIQDVVDQLLDAVEQRREMDVIADFAFPLPAIVISEMLGIPVQDREKFRSWANAITSFQGTGRARPDLALKAQDNLLEVRQYFGEIFSHRRLNPGNDLISALVTAEVEGDKLSEAELVSTCTTLLLAGHETTTCLLANGLLTLLRFPDQLDALLSDLSLMPSAVDEINRYETPLQRIHKLVAKNVELGQEKIQEGDIVMLMYGAAHRDSTVFPKADLFDIRRSGHRNLAFGHGIHYCLGAPLAQLETEIALSTVLRRLPDLRLDATNVEWADGTIFRIPVTLPVTF